MIRGAIQGIEMHKKNNQKDKKDANMTRIISSKYKQDSSGKYTSVEKSQQIQQRGIWYEQM